MILNTIMKAIADGHPYETGEYRPTSGSRTMTVPFASAHPTRPAIIVLVDGNYIDSTSLGDTATLAWMFVDYSQLVGAMNITAAYGMMYRSYKDINVSTVQRQDNPITTEAALANYATNTQFFPSASSNSYGFKVGHGYKWIAIWL